MKTMNDKRKEYSKYNVMRSLIFYDLPMESENERKIYTKFRTNLIKLGYSQIQNSVYVKVLNSSSISKQHMTKLKKIVPSIGNVRVLVLTEKQYQDMKILSGSKSQTEILNDTNRYKEI